MTASQNCVKRISNEEKMNFKIEKRAYSLLTANNRVKSDSIALRRYQVVLGLGKMRKIQADQEYAAHGIRKWPKSVSGQTWQATTTTGMNRPVCGEHNTPTPSSKYTKSSILNGRNGDRCRSAASAASHASFNACRVPCGALVGRRAAWSARRRSSLQRECYFYTTSTFKYWYRVSRLIPNSRASAAFFSPASTRRRNSFAWSVASAFLRPR